MTTLRSDIPDTTIIAMLPSTSSEIVAQLRHDPEKKSAEFRNWVSFVNRRLESMERFGIVKWEKVIKRAKVWEVI